MNRTTNIFYRNDKKYVQKKDGVVSAVTLKCRKYAFNW
ncbi:hypothetical protein D1AOALGA4SA_5948 [Olavius algarvensis Delta 1 endosymbiont]|nr:hypothetical protein D1AOALGA4SA_5948 [Olavius algarvensis Delta 1 endosymbiont]